MQPSPTKPATTATSGQGAKTLNTPSHFLLASIILQFLSAIFCMTAFTLIYIGNPLEAAEHLGHDFIDALRNSLKSDYPDALFALWSWLIILPTLVMCRYIILHSTLHIKHLRFFGCSIFFALFWYIVAAVGFGHGIAALKSLSGGFEVLMVAVVLSGVSFLLMILSVWMVIEMIMRMDSVVVFNTSGLGVGGGSVSPLVVNQPLTVDPQSMIHSTPQQPSPYYIPPPQQQPQPQFQSHSQSQQQNFSSSQGSTFYGGNSTTGSAAPSYSQSHNLPALPQSASHQSFTAKSDSSRQKN